MIAYKVFRVRKNGTLGFPFINKKAILPINEWLYCEEHITKGFSFRPFFHCIDKPEWPKHLSQKNRILLKVEIQDYFEMNRPSNQGGKWLLAKQIKIL